MLSNIYIGLFIVCPFIILSMSVVVFPVSLLMLVIVSSLFFFSLARDLSISSNFSKNQVAISLTLFIDSVFNFINFSSYYFLPSIFSLGLFF